MSFSVELMYNASPSNKVGKTLTSVSTVTGTLRAGSSIHNPKIEIELASPATLATVNYAYISTWNRYYFVLEPYLDITGLYVLPMHVDVLESHKTAIKAQNAIVARSENHWNSYLDDGWFMAYQNPEINTVYFSEQSPFLQDGEYILVIAGS